MNDISKIFFFLKLTYPIRPGKATNNNYETISQSLYDYNLSDPIKYWPGSNVYVKIFKY